MYRNRAEKEKNILKYALYKIHEETTFYTGNFQDFSTKLHDNRAYRSVTMSDIVVFLL